MISKSLGGVKHILTFYSRQLPDYIYIIVTKKTIHQGGKKMLNVKTKNSTNTTNSKKGEKIMKRILKTIVTMMIMVVMLTGCSNPFRKDEKNATVSITTSDGQAHVYKSVNGSDATVSGKEYALRKEKIKVNMKTGETAHIVFKCDACGNEQEFNIDQPWSDIISCDCPEKINKDGNAKEYAAIEIEYDQEEAEKEEAK